MDYRGGTYVSQVAAPSPTKAYIKGAENLDARQIFGFGDRAKASLVEQMKEDAPVLLNGLTNAWCNCAQVRGKLAVITLVQTEVG
jgi:hypothetical protein